MCASGLGLALLFAAGAASAAASGAAVVQALDGAGAPLADAAVYAVPLSGQTGPRSTKPVEISQHARKFIPLVTVVQAGTEVSFPNHDTVRHHVYSFSPPKVFELKLYAGVPAKPVLFDKPGTVVLGCNIHDQMIAYVQVVNTPWFAKTGPDGKAHLDNLPPGRYKLEVWHYRLPPTAPVPEKEITIGDNPVNASFTLSVNPSAQGK